MTAPTRLDDDDDLIGAPWPPACVTADHRWAFRDGRWIHRAACPCWTGAELAPASAAAPSCRYCKKDHEDAGVCRWARWLRRG
jgi:hypothetical protein